MTRRWKRTIPMMSAFVVGLSVFVAAVPQHGQRFNRQWGSNFRPNPDADRWRRDEERRRRPRHHPSDAREMIAHWNTIAIDAAGLDHTEVGPGEERVFGEEFGPGRSARAMAMVHIAIFDAANAIAGHYRGFSQMPHVPEWTSMEAAVASAAHDALVAMYPSQAEAMNEEMAEDLVGLPNGPAKTAGIRLGQRAAALIIQSHTNDGSQFDDPLIGTEFITKNAPGKWRQDPIGLQPIALGATWGQVKPFVIPSGARFRVPPPPPLTSDEYTEAYNEVKRLGGDGITTPTERTEEQTFIGMFWAYDGTPSLCAPPRLYNQITMTIANKMRTTNPVELARLLALVNIAMADAGIASWESKYYYQFWRPITAIRESDPGTGPTGLGDGNADTAGDPDLDAARRAGEQSERPELHAAVPRLHVRSRDVRRRDLPDPPPLLRHRQYCVHVRLRRVERDHDGQPGPRASAAPAHVQLPVGGRRRERPEPDLSRHPLRVRQERRHRSGPPRGGLRVEACVYSDRFRELGAAPIPSRS